MFKVHARRVIFFAVLGLIAALVWASSLPRMYEASAAVLVNDASKGSASFNEDVNQMLRPATSIGVATEAHFLKLPVIFESALTELSNTRTSRASLVNELEELYNHYQVGSGANSNIVELRVRAHDPDTAKELADTIIRQYSEQRMTQATSAFDAAARYLSDKVESSREDLRKAETALKAFKEEKAMADLSQQTAEVASYWATLRSQRDDAQTQLRAVDAEIANQRMMLTRLPKQVKDSINETMNPTVVALQGQIAGLETTRLEALRTYRDDSRRVQDIDKLISEAKKKLVDEQSRQWQEQSRNFRPDPIRTNVEQALATNTVLRSSLQRRVSEANRLLGEQDRRMRELPANEMRYAELVRDRDVKEQMYRHLRTQKEALDIKTMATVQAASVAQWGIVKDEPVFPDTTKMGIVGTISGICIGLLITFLVEALKYPVRSSAQLTELTGLPVAATVPMLPKRRARNMLSALPSADARPSESFRYMAFAQLARENGPPKIVMFTGIGGSVGCSTAAAQYALATSQTGVRTLLVDCDLRHPAITEAFEAHDKSGISDMLNRTLLASDAVDMTLDTEHKHLRLVPAGTDAGSTGGLAEFPTSHIIGIIDSLRDRGDVIVVDAPPCDVVSDAARLVPYVDQVCLVVSASSTSFREVPIAYEILKRSGAKEINLILTHASPQDEPFSKRSKYLVSKN